jgi:hypothetical protein
VVNLTSWGNTAVAFGARERLSVLTTDRIDFEKVRRTSKEPNEFYLADVRLRRR